MADDALSSPYHFSRLLSRATGEPPVAMRRRVLLERAAWQLVRGTSVTDAAWVAGYGSLEGFSRAFTQAFGRSPPSPAGARHWLPAPNGIHLHPPTSLWVRAEEPTMNPLTEQMVAHDLDDTRTLLETASVIAHVLTYAAHRRQVVRRMLAAAGREVDGGDPIMWLRGQRGETG